MTEILTFEDVGQLELAHRQAGWSIDMRQMQRGPFSASFALAPPTELLLAFAGRHDTRTELQAGPPPGFAAVALPHAGQTIVQGEAATEAHLVWMPDGSSVHSVIPPGVSIRTALIPNGVLEEAWNELAPEAPSRLADSCAPFRIRSEHAAALRSLVQGLVLEVPAARVATSEAAAALCAGIVTALAPEQPRSSRRPNTTTRLEAHRAVARAREYIEAHLAVPLRMVDICRYAGVGVRSLQRYFRQELDLTPGAYIEARRLDAARRRLGSSSAETASVTGVAMSSGFLHLGRFAVTYRGFFGEAPRDTLGG